MGISYEELGVFGRLRKISRCGPVSAFWAAVHLWRGRFSPEQIAAKVKFFFRCASGEPQALCGPLPPRPLTSLLTTSILDTKPSPKTLDPLTDLQFLEPSRHYAMNRHKATTITPSYHAESYSPDDNRFDHRQFLYRVAWPWQFARIDHAVDALAVDSQASAAPS